MKNIYTLWDGKKIDVNEIVTITNVYERTSLDIITSKNWFEFVITFRNRKEGTVQSKSFKVGRFLGYAKDPELKATIKQGIEKEHNKLVKIWESL